MQKAELKELVKKYFNLTETNKEETLVENTPEKFTEAKLADGTVITNMVDADFEVGQELHVITESGEHVIAPSGEHTTESGIVITVDGEGKITGVKHPDQEGEGTLEAEQVEPEGITEMAEEEIIEEEVSMEDMDIEDKIIEAIAEVVMPELESMKAKMAEHDEKMAEYEEKMKNYMSATPASESKTTSSPANKFSKSILTKNEGPKHNKQRYEMALARLTNLNN